ISTNPGPWDFIPDSETAEARADATAGKWILAIGFLAIPLFFIALGTIALVRGPSRDDAISMIGVGLLFAGIILGIVWYSRRGSPRDKLPNDSHSEVRAHRGRGRKRSRQRRGPQFGGPPPDAGS